MAKETEISVPDRRPLVDLSIWFPMLQYCVSCDHEMLSPHCKSRTMEYVKLPHDENGQPLGQTKETD
jgi:hypothetical protein